MAVAQFIKSFGQTIVGTGIWLEKSVSHPQYAWNSTKSYFEDLGTALHLIGSGLIHNPIHTIQNAGGALFLALYEEPLEWSAELFFIYLSSTAVLDQLSFLLETVGGVSEVKFFLFFSFRSLAPFLSNLLSFFRLPILFLFIPNNFAPYSFSRLSPLPTLNLNFFLNRYPPSLGFSSVYQKCCLRLTYVG